MQVDFDQERQVATGGEYRRQRREGFARLELLNERGPRTSPAERVVWGTSAMQVDFDKCRWSEDSGGF